MSNSSSRRGLLATIFISPDERRFRAGWRLLLHAMLVFLITGILVSVILLFLQDAALLSTTTSSLGFLLETIAILIATFIARRALDRRTFVSLGFELNEFAFTDLLLGFFIPGILMGFIFLVEWSLGYLTFEGFAWQVEDFSSVLSGLGSGFAVFVMVAISEELLSRGYHLQNITEGTNLFWGLLISSSLFSVLHLTNPNSGLTAVAGLIGAGIFLAFGWMRTGQLWLPIGLHLGWNFFEGNIFGFPVSGLETFRLIRHSIQGPVWLTGGAFGPEAGFIILPAMAFGIVLMVIFTRGRSGISLDLFEVQKLSAPAGSIANQDPGDNETPSSS
jgi:membrane protease YdiL (CAAX protease family)